MNGGRVLLEVDGLSVAFGEQAAPVLENVELRLEIGKVLAVVGESGSGKTMLARSIIGLLPPGALIRSGRLIFSDQDLSALGANTLRELRGDRIGMVFQEPQVSLNPVIRIGQQLTEAMLERGATPVAAHDRAVELLERVRIPDPVDVLQRYPHELSGGMCQRIMIAAALMLEPELLIADEPTTALDCSVQRDVLEVMLEAAQEEDTAVLLVSHDLGLVAGYADDVLVLKDGKVVEHRATADILTSPTAAYTRELLEAATVVRPDAGRCASDDVVCAVREVTVDYPVRRDWPWQQRNFMRAVDSVSLHIHRGETLALVGESGSGKTSLGRAILGLVDTSAGTIEVNGHDIASAGAHLHRFAQLIFQNPYAALSPRKTVWQSVAEPLQIDRSLDAATVDERTRRMLDDVGLSGDLTSRRPHELSGGQRQRVSIARALITEPGLVIADEPVSALDVTIQAQILEMFAKLQEKYGFACLFITHDLGVVEELADRVAVLKHGRVVEYGSTQNVFANPGDDYTKELLSAMPMLQHDNASGFRIVNRQFNEAPA